MAAHLTGILDRTSVRLIAAVFAAGGVAVLPTDTVYGFHCTASNNQAIERILKLKGKSRSAGLILLACGIEMVDRLVAYWPAGARTLLTGIWPAALTAVLPASGAVHPPLSQGGRVAVRVPAIRKLRLIIDLLGEPLVSTSVNTTGGDPLTRIAEIRRAFPDLAAYLTKVGRSSTVPSTVVDLTSHRPRLVREGRYHWPRRTA